MCYRAVAAAAADVTLTTQTVADDEFVMCDEDISVKLPRSIITAALHAVTGEIVWW